MWSPFPLRAYATPFKAKLSASVPPPVKTISSGLAPMREATFSLASSTAALASWPNEWMLEGLPYRSVRYGSMAWTTSGWTGVVAA